MNTLVTHPDQRQRHVDDQALRALQQRLSMSPRQLAWLRMRFLLLHLSRAGGGLIKRLIDLLVASSVLVLALPLMLTIGLLINLTDGGPVLFWQVRVGKWGRHFPFPKFRSMVVNAEAVRARLLGDNQHGQGITFKMRHDPRITWIGSLIRKTSIDELPQLWCVIKGDMSLVGPRPALVGEVERYTLEDRRRLEVKPGLTCIWQVSGRSEIPFDEQCRMDVRYIEEQSVKADLRLLLRTIPAVVTGRGAY